MGKKILEVCVDSYVSAIAAYNGGANRLELCQNLIIGGTTPDPFLYAAVKEAVEIPVHVLIRPRFGDFCYSREELCLMKKNIEFFQKEQADGIVIGALNPDGTLNEEAVTFLIEDTKDMHRTLHRAFDMCKDPFKTMNTAKKLGFQTILTSGQKNRCREGKDLLKDMNRRAEVTIMAGGGIDADAIRELYQYTGITTWHMSGKKRITSSMIYRNPDVSMGIGSISEYDIYQTSEAEVWKAREVLDAPDCGFYVKL